MRKSRKRIEQMPPFMKMGKERHPIFKQEYMEEMMENYTAWHEEMNERVETMREISVDKPLRVVIDEIFPGEIYRILTAEMVSTDGKPDLMALETWGEEEPHYMTKPQLLKLLTGNQKKDLWEGKVFRVKAKRALNLSPKARKHVNDRTQQLLQREGWSGEEIKSRR
jgi:hypothetical protein